MEAEGGGTKVRRNRNVQNIQQQPPAMGMGPPMNEYQREIPMQMGTQMQMPPQMQMPTQQGPGSGYMGQGPGGGYNMPSSSHEIKFDFKSKNFKMTALVIIIFMMFNSKIIWRQITRFPMMGEYEPTIIALIVNALLAGIVFYLLSKLI